MDKTFLSNLEWRSAIKSFDPSKKIDSENLKTILHSIKMAPSSFGLQPYHVYVVSDQATKTKLKEKGYNQQQLEDASHVLVFCERNDLNSRIDQYFELATGGDKEKRKAMESYEAMMRGFHEGKSEEAIKSWASKQVYIALGFALAACAELGIDSCPMEGFDSKGFDEILNIPEYMSAVVALPIGIGMVQNNRNKVRYSAEDLFTEVL